MQHNSSLLESVTKMAPTFGYLASAVGVSALTGVVLTQVEQVTSLIQDPTSWLVLLGIVLVATFALLLIVNRANTMLQRVLLVYGYSALMGVAVAGMILKHSLVTVATALGGGVVLFIIMALIGLTTNRNLERVGEFSLYGLIAVIVALFINNYFLVIPGGETTVSFVLIALFMLLTASDVQTIRDTVVKPNATHADHMLGAITLYLNLLNMFGRLLQLGDD